MLRRSALACVSLVFALSACSGGEAARDDASVDDGARARAPERTSGGESGLDYGEEARSAYARALLQFRRGDCLEAEPAFQSIHREYPYSRFAALSELRVGDCQFKQKNYTEAIQTYRTFVRYRPSHDQVPYARFRIAQAHYKQIPREWLLSPPTHERDQTPAHDALRQLRRFVHDFPNDDRVPEANKMIHKTLAVLARHELYAARFYRHLDADEAVIRRLETLLDRYEGSGYEAEALLLLAEVQVDADRPGEARHALTELLERFPEAEQVADARELLAGLPPPARGARPEAREPPAPEAEPEPAPEPGPDSD
jgi:outer membrane protein assembly factor BamD